MADARIFTLFRSALLCATILGGCAPALADDGPEDNDGQMPLPTGQFITPTFATGSTIQNLNPQLADLPNHLATHAVQTAVSPDGKTLLVLTSGYNLAQGASGADNSEYVFVYDISTPAHQAQPAVTQVLHVPNSFCGLVWDQSGTKFYVSGGASDAVFVFTGAPGSFALSKTISLNHINYETVLAASGNPTLEELAPFASSGYGFADAAATAGIGLSPDGTVLVAVNIANDSISVINTATQSVVLPGNTVSPYIPTTVLPSGDIDLRPYASGGASGAAGGEVPFGVIVPNDTTAYVTSIRDREVDVVNLTTKKVTTRISLDGNPNSIIMNKAGTTAYVAEDNSDEVAVISLATNTVTAKISTIAPAGTVPSGSKYMGATPNNLALSPDQNTLYVTNGAANTVAVIPLTGPGANAVATLIPTGWYPNAVSVSADGAELFVASGKSDPGADPDETVGADNQYILQLEAATLLAVPAPAAADYSSLTRQVASNNGYATPASETAADAQVMAALRSKIKHVIYIVRENRTFDQILGDLTNGANADPSLVMFGRVITPNIHKVAQNFVTLDNFFDTGEVSGNGWNWSTGARETDFSQKSIPPNYAGRAFSNDSEGTNRNVDVGLTGLTNRTVGEPAYPAVAGAFPGGAANLLPGNNNDFGLDGPTGTAVQSGYIWDAATRAGLSVRDYGFFIDVARYELDYIAGLALPVLENPATTCTSSATDTVGTPCAGGTVVAYNTSPDMPLSATQTVAPGTATTDPYFRGFDNVYPDIWREQEWAREFNNYVAADDLPNLTLLRLMHDHMGFSPTPIGNLNTPERQVADNDYAVGQVIQTVANSPYANSTLIFVIEDDAQDGDDHMDAHRSVGFVVGPYVKHNALVHTRYSTVNMVRTIEDILGTDHLNLNDAYARPMTDVFNLNQTTWSFTAAPSAVLQGTVAAIDPATKFAEGSSATTHDYAYWAEKTKGFDFSDADRVPADLFNRVLWEGLKGGAPYPETRSGKIIRASVHADAAN